MSPALIPTLGLSSLTLDTSVAGLLSYEQALSYTALPIKQSGKHLWVAMSKNHSLQSLKELSYITGMYIMPVICDADDIKLCINQLLASAPSTSIKTQSLVDARISESGDTYDLALVKELSAAPTVRAVDSFIEAGIMRNASDIHIEPYNNSVRVRLRIDGMLQLYNTLNQNMLDSILSRLKIIGGMDITEKRRPQDGRFTMHLRQSKIDFRLSTMLTALGEKAVLRLLHENTRSLSKNALGFFDDDLAALTTLFNAPSGMIFITGPTGSGKSTTLSSFMSELNCIQKNIVTLEDPVENPIPGINHINVDKPAGVDFASLLRHTLRQDPDIIMVGEVRDEETARVAIKAATTGHTMLCTIHTNDAAGVVERLIDMGIEPYLVASALRGVISQRLVRRICNYCKAPSILDAERAKILQLGITTQVYAGTGCERCSGTGFGGRVAVYEYIVITAEMQRLISRTPYEFVQKMRTGEYMRKNIARHVIAGNTSVEEVMRIL